MPGHYFWHEAARAATPTAASENSAPQTTQFSTTACPCTKIASKKITTNQVRKPTSPSNDTELGCKISGNQTLRAKIIQQSCANSTKSSKTLIRSLQCNWNELNLLYCGIRVHLDESTCSEVGEQQNEQNKPPCGAGTQMVEERSQVHILQVTMTSTADMIPQERLKREPDTKTR